MALWVYRDSVQRSTRPNHLSLNAEMLFGLWDRLADLVGGWALTRTIIGCDGEIVRSPSGQTAYGGGCDGAHRNGSVIEMGCLSNVDFIATEGGAGDRVPRESSRRGCYPATSTTRRRDNQRHRDCFSIPGALPNRDGGIVGPGSSSARVDGYRECRLCCHLC